ncbi:MAG TPA: FHA domain-containing protein [Blastocatellia bacterium]|nr:FHA domain-containing protein [Blastocatellia bacterium]
MADKNDSVLDKAEQLARRVLERLGSTVDSKLGGRADAALSYREVSSLTARIEREIEANLRPDSEGVKRIAPNRIRVGFTYERATEISQEYLDALAKELKAATYEFIVNRRYSTLAPYTVEATSDLFAKATSVRGYFDGDPAPETGSPSGSAKPAPASRTEKTLELKDSDGRSYRITLKADSAPATIGRTAGNALQLDHKSVSRLHCSLALKPGGQVVVADLGSANGTTVNGQALAATEARPLNPGDVLGVGDLRLSLIEVE